MVYGLIWGFPSLATIFRDIGSPSDVTGTGLYLQELFEMIDTMTVHILILFGRRREYSCCYNRNLFAIIVL
jgi:hypothetical protein